MPLRKFVIKLNKHKTFFLKCRINKMNLSRAKVNQNRAIKVQEFDQSKDLLLKIFKTNNND